MRYLSKLVTVCSSYNVNVFLKKQVQATKILFFHAARIIAGCNAILNFANGFSNPHGRPNDTRPRNYTKHYALISRKRVPPLQTASFLRFSTICPGRSSLPHLLNASSIWGPTVFTSLKKINVRLLWKHCVLACRVSPQEIFESETHNCVQLRHTSLFYCTQGALSAQR